MKRLLAALAFAFAFAMPAQAAHHGAHRHHHHAHHRHHAGEVAHRRASAAAVLVCNMQGCLGERAAAATIPLPFAASSLVNAARSSIGSSARDLGVRQNLWCMAALNKWLGRAGLRQSGSDMASSALDLGPHVSGPQVGAVAFMYRHGGGHAGVVTGVTADGDPVIISGNHNNRVREEVYSRSVIRAYVLPLSAG